MSQALSHDADRTASPVLARSAYPSAALLTLVPLAALVARLVADSDPLRATLVVAACAVATAGLAAQHVARHGLVPPRLACSAPHLGLFLLAMLIGAYGLALGLWRGNDAYYLAAGAYHWAVELLAIALLTSALTHRLPAGEMVRLCAVMGLVLGTVSVIAIAGGYAGVVQHGGHFVGGGSEGIWLFNAGLMFPQILLIYVLAALWFSRDTPAITRRALIVAAIILTIVLVMTFKRTMWLTTLIAVAVLWLPHARLLWLTVVLSLIAAAGITYAVMDASRVFSLLDFLTYNPEYRVTDTMADRSRQLADVWRYVPAQPLGHGMGAEFHTFAPGSEQRVDVHYIHNIYLTCLLQFGLPATVLAVQLWFVFATRTIRAIGRAPAWDWLLRATLASLVVFALSGTTLNATHTVWMGLAVGLGAAAITASARAAANRDAAHIP